MKNMWIDTILSTSEELIEWESVSSLDYGSVKAGYYKGLPYMGKETKVFAYIGYPIGASTENKVPAVVCAHGGGGTAFAEWVKLWNEKGYAAIAMDLEGRQPRTAGAEIADIHGNSGPTRDGEFVDIHKPIKDQWIYHAVADIILAGSLLRNNPLIDPLKIGVMGISWGGLVTSIVIGIDERFSFAIPVYGCGYLMGQNNYFGLSFTKNPSTQIWEPSNFIPSAKMPVLWLNDDLDKHFPSSSTSLSYENTRYSHLVIKNGLPHGHSPGWSPKEIFTFADSIVKNGIPLVRITEQPSKQKHFLRLSLPSGVFVKSAKIFYSLLGDIYDADSNCLADWQNRAAQVNSEIVSFEIPVNTKAYYIAIYDNRDLVITSKLIYIN